MRNSEDRDLSWLFALGGIIVLAVILFVFPPLSFKLEGPERYVTNLGDTYEDPGYSLKLFGVIDLSNLVQTSDTVNPRKEGTYVEEYTYRIGLESKTLERTVVVQDIDGPVIESSYPHVLVLTYGEEIPYPSFTAMDNSDGDCSDTLVYGGMNSKYFAYQFIPIYAEDDKGNQTTYIQPAVVLGSHRNDDLDLPEGIFYNEITGTEWYFYGYVADRNGQDMYLRLRDGNNIYDLPTEQLDTHRIGYMSVNVDLSQIPNGNYHLESVQGDTVLYPTIEYIDDVLMLGRVQAGDKLVTWGQDDIGMTVTVEDFEYEYDIVIDVGHGGSDVGAIAVDGTYEKDINLEVSLYEKERYEELGLRVKLIRETDQYTDLLGQNYWLELQKESWTLGWYAVTSHYAYSNHHNSHSDTTIRGPEIILNAQPSIEDQPLPYELYEEFRRIYPKITTKYPISTRDMDTGARLTKANGETYDGVRTYYAFLRIPWESFNYNSVLYEGAFINNEEEYEWYWEKGNWKKVSEAKIKAYVEALGKTYTPPKK